MVFWFTARKNSFKKSICTQIWFVLSMRSTTIRCTIYPCREKSSIQPSLWPTERERHSCRSRLFVREDSEHRVNVIGTTEIELRNLDCLRAMITDGLTRRHHGKSAFNSNSSRSHAIFQIALKSDYDASDDFRYGDDSSQHQVRFIRSSPSD